MCGFEFQARFHPRRFLCGSRTLGGGAQSLVPVSLLRVTKTVKPYAMEQSQTWKETRKQGNKHRRNKGVGPRCRTPYDDRAGKTWSEF